jgi:hypothetical protein
MACKSSVAEITGKSRTNAQPRVQSRTRDCSALLVFELEQEPLKELAEEVLCRQSRYAGNSKESQQRLRKSSIQNATADDESAAILPSCNYFKILRIA